MPSKPRRIKGIKLKYAPLGIDFTHLEATASETLLRQISHRIGQISAAHKNRKRGVNPGAVGYEGEPDPPTAPTAIAEIADGVFPPMEERLEIMRRRVAAGYGVFNPRDCPARGIPNGNSAQVLNSQLYRRSTKGGRRDEA